MVNRAERRGGFTNTSLTVPWAPGLPISLCFFHCNHTGKNETGSPKNKGGGWRVAVAAGAGRQQACEVGALHRVGTGPSPRGL